MADEETSSPDSDKVKVQDSEGALVAGGDVTVEGDITIQGRSSGDEQLLQKMAETIDKLAETVAQLASSSLDADEDTKDSTQPTPKDPSQVDWDGWDKVFFRGDGAVVYTRRLNAYEREYRTSFKVRHGQKYDDIAELFNLIDSERRPPSDWREHDDETTSIMWGDDSTPHVISTDSIGTPLELDVKKLHLIYHGSIDVLVMLHLTLDPDMPPHPAIDRKGKKYTEILRRDLIWKAILGDMDLSRDMLFRLPSKSLSNLCGIFGIKRSGSLIQKRQRLWLHLYMDPYALNPDTIQDMSRGELHELCREWGLKRSGSKTQLLNRVVDVIVREEGNWGKIKKSLRKRRED